MSPVAILCWFNNPYCILIARLCKNGLKFDKIVIIPSKIISRWNNFIDIFVFICVVVGNVEKEGVFIAKCEVVGIVIVNE